jgi:type II secretory pathway component PulL
MKNGDGKARIAFFDLREEELSIFILEKKNHAVLSRHAVPLSEGSNFSFVLDEKVAGIDESYLSLPLGLLNFRIVELPFSDMRKVMELLPFELDGLILGGTGDVVFDVCLLGNENGRSKVLVAYIRKEVLKTILNNLKSYGFDPRAVLSLELGHAVAAASKEGFASNLLAPVPIENNERVGIAVRELQKPTADFRKGEFANTADTEKARKSLRITAALAALLLLLFLADTTMNIVSARRENQDLRDEIRKTYQALFPAEKKITSETYQLKAHLKELKDRESSFVGVSPLETLRSLTLMSRPGVSLSEVSVEKDIIILKGECPSLSEAQRIKAELEDVLTGVSISDTRPSPGNKTFFTITAKGLKA